MSEEVKEKLFRKKRSFRGSPLGAKGRQKDKSSWRTGRTKNERCSGDCKGQVKIEEGKFGLYWPRDEALGYEMGFGAFLVKNW